MTQKGLICRKTNQPTSQFIICLAYPFCLVRQTSNHYLLSLILNQNPKIADHHTNTVNFTKWLRKGHIHLLIIPNNFILLGGCGLTNQLLRRKIYNNSLILTLLTIHTRNNRVSDHPTVCLSWPWQSFFCLFVYSPHMISFHQSCSASTNGTFYYIVWKIMSDFIRDFSVKIGH